MPESRFIIGLLLWIISLLALADETGLVPIYTFVGNENYPPLIYKQENKASGLIVDIAKAVAEKGGFNSQVLAMEWLVAQKKVQDGELDALLLVNKNPQREQLYDFSTPLFESEFVFFRLQKRTDIALPQSLYGKSVGVEKGGYTTSLMQKYPDIQKVTIANLHEGFKLLSQGKIDALITERWAGEFELAETGIAGIVVVPQPIKISTSYIAVRKGNTALLQRINAGLAQIELDVGGCINPRQCGAVL
jgi:ABC-type amino acid transport substrate-binding protein